MELNEKLQLLRKQRGITQEELAEKLYVSRTAVSKWESGRGMPSIDSLKALSRFFAVSLDDLLCGDELLKIAETDHREREKSSRTWMRGLVDIGQLLLIFLPLFGKQDEQAVKAVSLLLLGDMQPYIRVLYWVAILGMGLLGALSMVLIKKEWAWWQRYQWGLSLAGGTALVLLFSLTRQPYATVFSLAMLIIKGVLLLKKP